VKLLKTLKMKSIYLKAEKTQDVFNDLKNNFNGTLIANNDEFNLILSSSSARGNIKGISFPGGMTYMEFDVIFHDDTRLSMESLRTSPIFFAYCSQGAIQHSFGEQGERKIIKKQQAGILKSSSSVNTILHFEKHIPIKFYVIQIGIDTAVTHKKGELINKLKNTFFNTKEDYLEIKPQNFKVAQKIEELNALIQKGKAVNVLKNSILESILELEIEHHTDGFSKIAQTVNSLALKQIDEIKRVSNTIKDISFEIFATDFIAQKAGIFVNRLQKEFRLMFSRSVHNFLIYIRIERGRI
jgi:hypothetical protein